MSFSFIIVHHKKNTSQGFREYNTREKIITLDKRIALPYYSERDISGNFKLNYENVNEQKKPYAILELDTTITFADSISYLDYEIKKESVMRLGNSKENFEFNENRNIPGLSQYNLVSITENEPCLISWGFFVIFTIFLAAEPYKAYFKSLYIYQYFTIKKIVSTRYDLNKSIYQSCISSITLINKTYEYKPEDYNYINNELN